MSDLYLIPTAGGGELSITDGKPLTTSGLETAVYLSLFTGSYWGNAIAPAEERYDSELEDLFARPLTNATRLAVINEYSRLLTWMTDTGVAASVTVDAEIARVGVLHIVVRITEPGGDVEEFAYQLNWQAQEATPI